MDVPEAFRIARSIASERGDSNMSPARALVSLAAEVKRLRGQPRSRSMESAPRDEIEDLKNELFDVSQELSILRRSIAANEGLATRQVCDDTIVEVLARMHDLTKLQPKVRAMWDQVKLREVPVTDELPTTTDEQVGEMCSGYNGCTPVSFPDGSVRCADCGRAGFTPVDDPTPGLRGGG